ncbi:MAG: MFS transporter [Myxococcaceae bacterium]|nr:MFS transporter [Myxococcaceae bacterium]
MPASGQPAEATAGPAARAAGFAPLAGYYLLYFATTGILLPYLPAWLKSLGLPASQVGVLIALQPTWTLIAPPLWGHLADRFGRPDRVLSAISLGAVIGFAPLLVTERFWPIVLALTAYAFFASAITSIADSLALHRVALRGGSYARIRLFGSIGFVLSTSAFGFAVDKMDRRVIAVALALMGAYFLWTFTLRAQAAAVPGRHPLQGLTLLRHRDLALVLLACALHWIASAPYHGNFGIHVIALHLPPWVIGVSAALGVIAEILVMYLYPRVAERLAPRHVLLVAFVGSAVRWTGMALVDGAAAIIALSLLHGLSFGAFYVAAVQFVSRRVPATLRATGQALMASVTFGVGGLVGYVSAGAGYELLGGHRLFAAAAVLELVPAALILFARPASATDG